MFFSNGHKYVHMKCICTNGSHNETIGWTVYHILVLKELSYRAVRAGLRYVSSQMVLFSPNNVRQAHFL